MKAVERADIPVQTIELPDPPKNEMGEPPGEE